jgi:hypothetical protein
MSETPSSNPARLPDPARVDGWRCEIKTIHEEVQSLVWWQEVDRRVAEIVRANDELLHSPGDFPARSREWYRQSAAMCIRRLVDQGSEGPVYSLRLLLEDMKRACEAFNRDAIDSLLDEPGAPQYEREFRDFLVSSMWRRVGDPKPDVDRLYSRHLKDDLKALADKSAPVKAWADKWLAHNSKERPEKVDLSRAQLDECIDCIHDITKRYLATLTGAGYSTLVPTYLGNWYHPFDIIWRAGHGLVAPSRGG